MDFAKFRVRGPIPVSGKSFLDIGFGQGLGLLSAESMQAMAVGCDINPKCAQGQDKKPQDQAMTDMVFEQQQVRTNQAPDAPRISVGGDAGGVHSINMLNKAIEAEQQGLRAVA